MEGRKLKDSVVDLLRVGLAASAGNSRKAGRKGQLKLPLIQCEAGAPVQRMSNREVNALNHETQTKEDLERFGKPL